MNTDFGRVRGIVLSYPRRFADPFYRGLTPFFDKLIRLLPSDIEVHLVVSSPECSTEIREKFDDRQINSIVVPGFNEVWLRDLLGFSAERKVIKPAFRPTYFKGIYTGPYLETISNQVNSILSTIGFDIHELDLAWDGGNLIHNGEIGFVTDKLLADNCTKSKSKIRSLIERELGIEPTFIPTFKYDQLGHADGYLNFIRKDTVTLSCYPSTPSLIDSQQYAGRLKELLFEKALSIVDIWDEPVPEQVKVDEEFLESARGIHNNFLQINGSLILPEYKSSARSGFRKYLDFNIKSLSPFYSSVTTVNCDHLSRLGGVLRCVSWCF